MAIERKKVIYNSVLFKTIISFLAFAAWNFNVGSFCLVMHTKLESLSLDDRTVDAFWKARIIEIRRSKMNESVCDYLRTRWVNYLLSN